MPAWITIAIGIGGAVAALVSGIAIFAYFCECDDFKPAWGVLLVLGTGLAIWMGTWSDRSYEARLKIDGPQYLLRNSEQPDGSTIQYFVINGKFYNATEILGSTYPEGVKVVKVLLDTKSMGLTWDEDFFFKVRLPDGRSKRFSLPPTKKTR